MTVPSAVKLIEARGRAPTVMRIVVGGRHRAPMPETARACILGRRHGSSWCPDRRRPRRSGRGRNLQASRSLSRRAPTPYPRGLRCAPWRSRGPDLVKVFRARRSAGGELHQGAARAPAADRAGSRPAASHRRGTRGRLHRGGRLCGWAAGRPIWWTIARLRAGDHAGITEKRAEIRRCRANRRGRDSAMSATLRLHPERTTW